jgi:hypothetical protein
MLYALKERGQIVDRVGYGAVDGEDLPVIFNIVECWSEFKESFYNVGMNIMKALIFENDVLGENGRLGIESAVFDRGRYARMRERLRLLRIEDITDDEGNMLMMADINARWRIQINWAEYFRLREELARIKER